MQYNMKSSRVDVLIDMYERAPERTIRAIYDTLDKTGNKAVENTVNHIKKKGLVDSGKLLQSTRTYPLSGLRQVIEVATQYALGLEEGTSPHWVPIKPLQRWARRKTGKEWVAYIVQKNIAERGTKPRYYFRDAIDDTLPEVTEYWDHVFDVVFGQNAKLI